MPTSMRKMNATAINIKPELKRSLSSKYFIFCTHNLILIIQKYIVYRTQQFKWKIITKYNVSVEQKMCILRTFFPHSPH